MSEPFERRVRRNGREEVRVTLRPASERDALVVDARIFHVRDSAPHLRAFAATQRALIMRPDVADAVAHALIEAAAAARMKDQAR